MKQLKATCAVIFCLTVLPVACGGPTIPQAFAQCESDAYVALGLQTDEAATADYLEKKSEVVRVCMLKQGFLFKSSIPDGTWMELSANIHKKYGVYEIPIYKIPKDVQRSIDDEIRKERAKLMLRSANWIR